MAAFTVVAQSNNQFPTAVPPQLASVAHPQQWAAMMTHVNVYMQQRPSACCPWCCETEQDIEQKVSARLLLEGYHAQLRVGSPCELVFTSWPGSAQLQPQMMSAPIPVAIGIPMS